MSQPAKRKAEGESSDVATAKRIAPRPFHAGPNPMAAAEDGQEHKDEAKPTAAATSPVRQPDISLRCVFGCLHLKELGRALSVSKQWRGNVCAMPSICAAVQTHAVRRPLCALYASPLARHVADLRTATSTIVSVADLGLLTARMPALRRLVLRLVMPAFAVGPALLRFPQRLTKLDLCLDWHRASTHTPRTSLLHRLLSGIGALASLEELTLDVSMDQPEQRAEVSFEPLRALHRLRCFNFSWLGPRFVEQQTLSAAQLDCVRFLANSHGLVSLRLFNGRIERLLQDMTVRNDTAPIRVHELDMDPYSSITAAEAPAMRCFPALRSLQPAGMEAIDFLPCMPHLHSLHVELPEDTQVTGEQLVSAIAPLTQLTDLHIHNHPTLNEEHLTRTLALLPLLRSLLLENLPQLRSLSFLASGPITHSLLRFVLVDCHHADLRTSSLLHLPPCSRLTELDLSSSFSDTLGEFGRALYEQRPCSTLPALQSFEYEPFVPEDE